MYKERHQQDGGLGGPNGHQRRKKNNKKRTSSLKWHREILDINK